MRNTGIESIGEAPWGTHLCQFYRTKKDIIEVLVPFFAEGLRQNECCIWAASESFICSDAKAALCKAIPNLESYLQRGQLEFVDSNQQMGLSRNFDAEQGLCAWAAKETAAMRLGYCGVRIGGDAFWSIHGNGHRRLDHERINNFLRGRQILALSTYCLDSSDAEDLSDAIGNHHSTLIKQAGKWVAIGVTSTDDEPLRKLNESLHRRVRQLQRLATEVTRAERRERRRLSQILHDHLQQLLYAARLGVGALKCRVRDDDWQAPLEQVDEFLRDSIEASRALTVDLGPPILYNARLPASIEWLGQHIQGTYGLNVSISTDPDFHVIGEDMRALLFHCVRELLLNVAKHAQTHHASVKLANLDDRHVQIQVMDEGAGFVPGDKMTDEALDAGFGLFGTRERLELVGGHLTVDSAPGTGTRVTITAPCAHPDDDPVRPNGDGSAGDLSADILRGQGGRSRKIRVLLADDHRVLREALARLLREQPELELVGEVDDGLKAVKAALSTQPDVVIMDVSMPALDGIEATRRITAALPDVRVIGLSVDEHEDMAGAMLEAGATVHLPKSGAFGPLIAAIRGTTFYEDN